MSDEEDDPIDSLILRKAEDRAAKKRAAEDNVVAEGSDRKTPGVSEPSAGPDGSKKKKRRKKSATPGASELEQPAAQPDAVADAKDTAGQSKAGPVGVIVLEEGDPEPNYEMQKLLRAPRYFDQVYEPKGVACWRCGKRGHLAKDCTLSEAKPCYYCAQYGHESRDCPHRICYRCGQPGHMTNDCKQRSATAASRGVCMRCGRSTCAASEYLDWFRYEGGCDQEYYSSDLDMVRCFVCGEKGHLSCQPAPLTAPNPSCWNCGGSHWAEECPEAFPSHLMAERLQDRDRQKQQRAQHEQWQVLQQQRQQLLMEQQAASRRQQQPLQPPRYQQQQQWGGQQQRYGGGQQQWAGQGGGNLNQAAGRYAAGQGNFQGQGNWQQQRQQYQQPQRGWQGQQQQGGWQGQQQGYQQQQQRRWQGQQQQQNDFPRGRNGGGGGGGNRRNWR